MTFNVKFAQLYCKFSKAIKSVRIRKIFLGGVFDGISLEVRSYVSGEYYQIEHQDLEAGVPYLGITQGMYGVINWPLYDVLPSHICTVEMAWREIERYTCRASHNAVCLSDGGLVRCLFGSSNAFTHCSF